MTEEKEEETAAKGKERGTPDQFVGRDLLESYIYYVNYVSSNPIERYNILVKAITFGKELLPYYDNTTEKDEDEKKKNKVNQERIDKLYLDADKVLNEEVPSKRKIYYDYVDAEGGGRVKLYKIESTENKDAQPCQAKEKELSTVLNNFITQQHEQHIPKLQTVYNQILHELTQVGIIPSINPTLDGMIEEEIKTLHREVIAALMVKQKEETDDGKKGKI